MARTPSSGPGYPVAETNGTNTPYTPRTPLSARRITNDENQPQGDESEGDRRQRELYSKQQHLLREQRSQDQDRLLVAIAGIPFNSV